MTYASSNAQALRAELGQRLREVRTEAGLSARALAALMGRHPSKVSRIENGAATPSMADIKLWCQHTQAGDREGELIDQLRRLEGMFVEWRRLERSGLRQFQETFVPLNYQTRKFRAYSSWLIPGPLQTEAYTRVLLNLIAQRRGFPNDIEEVMPVRARRDRALYEGDRTYAILLEEWVLRYGMGGSDVMAGQLGKLIEVATLPNVSLGIVPTRPDRVAWSVEDFWIYDDSRVTVELVSGHLSLTQPHDVELYARAFAQLAEQAVYGAAARQLIADALAALD
jgi:transcriptional regulator with XRE-family HTH domain